MLNSDREIPSLYFVLAAGAILLISFILSLTYPDLWISLGTAGRIVLQGLPILFLSTPLIRRLVTALFGKPKQENKDQGHSRVREQLQQSHQRMQALFSLNRLTLQAGTEDEIIDRALKLAVDLTDAQGASYVPLDRHAYPLEPRTYGLQPTTDLKAWVEYLASPTVHGRCQSCQKRQAVDNCPLLQDPFEQSLRLYCFPLRLGDRELGVINIYLQAALPLDAETQRFVQMVSDHLSLAIESVRLKHREGNALERARKAGTEPDLQHLLWEELEHVQTLFDTDFASLTLQGSSADEKEDHLAVGPLPQNIQQEIEELIQSVLHSGEPLIFTNGDHGNGGQLPGQHSIMAAPFPSQERGVSGVLLVGKRGKHSFHPQQLTVLESIVQQFALVIHNMRLMNELKVQSMLQERTRLAREIHDGLAQTLGYLKLQIAQIKRAVETDDLDRIGPIVQQSHQAVSDAYDDAREAIDGLQVDPTQKSFSAWLEQTVMIFKENSGMEQIQLDLRHTRDLSPEVQIQLIRIIQEALSNIRKHAQANKVSLESWDVQGGVSLEIRDNGRGFRPQETDQPMQHGLRGMRERARLINADFQITSHPGEGTTIRLHWDPTQEGSYI